jgi:hypothetical protein
MRQIAAKASLLGNFRLKAWKPLDRRLGFVAPILTSIFTYLRFARVSRGSQVEASTHE